MYSYILNFIIILFKFLFEFINSLTLYCIYLFILFIVCYEIKQSINYNSAIFKIKISRRILLTLNNKLLTCHSKTLCMCIFYFPQKD